MLLIDRETYNLMTLIEHIKLRKFFIFLFWEGQLWPAWIQIGIPNTDPDPVRIRNMFPNLLSHFFIFFWAGRRAGLWPAADPALLREHRAGVPDLLPAVARHPAGRQPRAQGRTRLLHQEPKRLSFSFSVIDKSTGSLSFYQN